MVSEAEVHAILDANPEFARLTRQFMMLHDAAAVLDEVKPPEGGTAAEYLREVASHLMADAGVPGDFVREMIAARPDF